MTTDSHTTGTYVLVVEDDPVLRAVVQRSLSDNGHRVDVAADLASAPDCGNCHQPLFAGAPVALAAGVLADVQRHVASRVARAAVPSAAP